MVRLCDIVIRGIQNNDYESFKKFAEAINKADKLEISINEQTMNYALSNKEIRDNIFFAFHEDKLIAFLGLFSDPANSTAKKASLELFVHPEYRRLGLGAILYDRIIEKARISEIKNLKSFCKQRLEKSISFLLKRGFKIHEYFWNMDLLLDKWNIKNIDSALIIEEITKDNIEEYITIMNDGFKKNDDDKYTNKSFEGLFVQGNSHVVMLKANGETIATAAYKTEEDINRGYIFNVAVFEKHRGKGYGKVILEYCVNKIKENGLHKASLLVKGDNINALKLYKNIGFEVMDTDVSYIKEL